MRRQMEEAIEMQVVGIGSERSTPGRSLVPAAQAARSR